MRFGRSLGVIQKSKMADQDGHNSEINVTSLSHDADPRGETLRHTISRPSFADIAGKTNIECRLLESPRYYAKIAHIFC